MPKRMRACTLGVGAIVLLSHVGASACAYNVRDVGFVDLKTMPYTLYLYVDNATPPGVAGDLEDALFMGLLDSNVESVIVNVDVDTEHEALKMLNEHKSEGFPAAILVSPKGFHRPVDIAESSRAGLDAVEAQLQSLITSPFRTTLLDRLAETYGVVLLVEGSDADENIEIKDAATRSVRKIHTRMRMLPKAIANPPIVMRITADQFEAETVLLWSLGIDSTKTRGAYAVILYGRGRQMGPVLTGEAITEERLTSYLSIIGADCECGLDRSWMQGTMIPLLWSDRIQSMVSTSLGFDPENPRTKMEISMTIAKGQRNRLNGGSDTKNPDAASRLSFAYKENVVSFDDEEPSILDDDSEEIVALAPSLLDGQTRYDTVEGVGVPALEAEDGTVAGDGAGASRLALVLIAGVTVVIMASSAGIVARVFRRG